MRPRFPYRGWLLDLDGTVYLGERLLPGADTAIAALRAAGRRIAFLTNKPLQTRTEYAAKLTRVINTTLRMQRATLDTRLNIPSGAPSATPDNQA